MSTTAVQPTGEASKCGSTLRRNLSSDNLGPVLVHLGHRPSEHASREQRRFPMPLRRRPNADSPACSPTRVGIRGRQDQQDTLTAADDELGFCRTSPDDAGRRGTAVPPRQELFYRRFRPHASRPYCCASANEAPATRSGTMPRNGSFEFPGPVVPVLRRRLLGEQEPLLACEEGLDGARSRHLCPLIYNARRGQGGQKGRPSNLPRGRENSSTEDVMRGLRCLKGGRWNKNPEQQKLQWSCRVIGSNPF